MILLYSIINYYNVRDVSMILIIIIMFYILNLINKNVFNDKINNLYLRVIACVIIVFIIVFFLGFPYEQKLLKFTNFEDAFKYNFPKESIYKTFEGDNYVYILYKTKRREAPYHLVHYVKKNNRWLILDSYSAESDQCRTTIFKNYMVKINKIDDSNLAVLVSYTAHDNRSVKVEDSIGSKFQTFPISENSSDGIDYVSIALIKKKIDDDYVLTIDGHEYIPFKDKNGDRFLRFLPFDFN